jgi:hypothetical protein
MSNDNGQLDISDRLKMTADAHAKPSEWTEIGQAEVIHTIFGKAKVRIIRKHDRIRRLFFRLTLFVALVFLLWQGWVLYQRYEAAQRNNFIFRINLNEHAGIPVSTHDTISMPESSGIMKNHMEGLAGNTASNANPTIKDKVEQPQNNLNSGKIAIRQFAGAPLKSVKPQSAPLAANGREPAKQAYKIVPPLQATTPLLQKNTVPLREVQVSPGSSVSAVPLMIPSSREEVAPAPAVETQLVEPASPKQ